MEWQDDWMDAKLYWSMLPLHAALFFDKQRKRKDDGDMRTIETKEAEKVLQKKRNKDVEDRGCGNKITKEAYESCAANCFVYFADS